MSLIDVTLSEPVLGPSPLHNSNMVCQGRTEAYQTPSPYHRLTSNNGFLLGPIYTGIIHARKKSDVSGFFLIRARGKDSDPPLWDVEKQLATLFQCEKDARVEGSQPEFILDFLSNGSPTHTHPNTSPNSGIFATNFKNYRF